MIRKFSKVLCLAVVAAMLLSVVACGRGSNDSAEKSTVNSTQTTKSDEKAPEAKEVNLKIYAQYSSDDEKIPYDYAVKALSEEMPNIKLELDIMAQDDNQKIKTYAASGNLPDIFQSNIDIINTFKKSNNILVLDEYVDKLKFKEKMFPSTMNLLISDDGHAYAFPYAGNDLVLLYYNKEIFEKNGIKVPTTYDELMTAVKAFKSKGIIPLSIFAKEKWPCVALYDIFATRMDPEGIIKMNSGKAKASDEAYKDAAQRIVELVKAGLLPKGATNLNYDQAAALFYQGKAAMFINGQWEISAATKNLGDKLDYMYYPATDAASYDKTKFSFSGGGAPGGYAVSSNTKDKDLAAKVAAFMAEKMAEGRYSLRGNVISATKVSIQPEKPFDPLMEKIGKDLPNITSTTAFTWGLSNAKIKAGLEDAAQKLMVEGYSADKFVSEMDKVIETANK